MSVVFVLFVSLIGFATCSSPLPDEIFLKLRSMHTKSDVYNLGLRIVESEARRLPINFNQRHRSRQKNVSVGGIITRNDENLQQPPVRKVTEEIDEIIRDPKQADNSCELLDICVPLPVQIEDASVFVFPQCIELPQCLGSCCDSLQRCHPRHSISVKVEVTKWQYSQENNGDAILREMEKSLVTMQKHVDCGCEQCRDRSLICGHLHVQKQCSCYCRNEHELINCQAPWKWSETDCNCQCQLKNCAEGEIVDIRVCKCFPALTIEETSTNTTEIKRMAIGEKLENANVAVLPKLRVGTKTRRPGRLHQ